MNKILKKKENMENLSQNFRTMVNLPEGIEAGVEVKTETKSQKVVTNVHLPSIRRKTVQVKNRLHLINKGIIQNICLREDKDFASLYRDTKKKNRTKFQVGEHSMLKQRPRNNQTVIAGEEHYDTMIVPETQDSQIPTNNEQENGETNDSFILRSGCHQQQHGQCLILDPKILNLLGIPLPKNRRIKLLSKGLKFTPTQNHTYLK